jgi:Acetyltransferase (GNAT) domain
VERVLDIIEHKVAEADFFLDAMRDSGFNIFGSAPAGTRSAAVSPPPSERVPAGAWRRCCHFCRQNPPASPAVKGDHLDMAELWFPVPPLAGDVVLLRPWREADVPGMVLAFSDPVMQRFSWRTTPYTETDARDYFAEQEEARLRGEGLNFALVEPRDQDVVLGAVSLQEVRSGATLIVL